MKELGVGIIQISNRHVRQCLGLPEDCKIVACRVPFGGPESLDIKVVSPKLPAVPEASEIPLVTLEQLQ